MVALSCKWNLLTVLMRVVDGRPGSTFLRTAAGPAGSHCSVQQVEGAGRIYNGEHDTLCTRRTDASVGGVITAVGSSSYLEEQNFEQKVHGMYYCIPP